MSFLNAGTVRINYRVGVRNVIEIIKINGVKFTPIILNNGVRITLLIQSGGIRITLLILNDIVNSGVRFTPIILSIDVK